VVAIAVELDGEAVFGPTAVDVVGAGPTVGQREREAVAGEQLEEPLL
jgi:hypothetical protein